MTKKLFEQFARIFALALHDNFKTHLDFIEAVNGGIVDPDAVQTPSRTSLETLLSDFNNNDKKVRLLLTKSTLSTFCKTGPFFLVT